MAEIKSTLDLVMEKTRHLTLSREEKEAQQREDTAKRLRGLVQKFQDGRLDQGQFVRQLEEMGKNGAADVRGLLVGELLQGLEVDGKNDARLVLLSEVCGVDVRGVEAVCRDYQETIRSMSRERVRQMRQNLARERGISGSSVIPNFESDPQWLEDMAKIREHFVELLEREKAVPGR